MRNLVIICGLLGALTVYAVAQNPSCGALNDTAVHTPQSYTCSAGSGCMQPGGSGSPPPLVPPSAVNSTITDPQYGCTIKRMTTFGEQQSGQASHNYYSTFTSVSANDDFLMIFQDNAAAYIISVADGSLVVPIGNMPSSNNSYVSTNVRPWDRSDGYRFYYTVNNQFVAEEINNGSPVSGCKPNCTLTQTVLYTFSNYSACAIPDQENVSQGNQYIWLVCTPSSGAANSVAVAYDFKNNVVLSSSLVVGAQNSGGWHKIQVFPSGKMLLTGGSLCNGTECIYNTDGTVYWQPPLTYSDHTGIGTDLSGHEVMITASSGVSSLNACGTQMWSSLTVIDINAEKPLNCLIGGTGTGCVGSASCAGPYLDNWEISYEDTPNGWVLLTLCEDGCGGPALPGIGGFDNCSTSGAATCVSGGATDLESNWASAWLPYDQEVILAKVDGSAIYRMAHHRSKDGENYWAIPVGTISYDADYIVFNSNWDISNTGDAQYADVYTIATGITTSSAAPSPPTNLQAGVSP